MRISCASLRKDTGKEQVENLALEHATVNRQARHSMPQGIVLGCSKLTSKNRSSLVAPWKWCMAAQDEAKHHSI